MINTNSIFSVNTQEEFKNLTLQIFEYQFENNKVYRSFCDLLYKHPTDVKDLQDIPFLPIQFFKTHKIISNQSYIQNVFESSGTTGNITSKHHVSDIKIYENSFRKGFKYFYGDIKDYVILALLPSYLVGKDSSLIYMTNDMINQSNHTDSGFYLNNLLELKNKLLSLEEQGKRTLLIGVSYALLDLIEIQKFNLKNTIVMETGGMKGRRKELIKEDLHDILKKGFGVKTIHSEYGMTELLSQAYSIEKGIFRCPNWMKILTRDTEDALNIQTFGYTGGINIIDLANINSCSFIATQDLGKVYNDGSFEVIGRFDNSDIRGCNLMVL